MKISRRAFTLSVISAVALLLFGGMVKRGRLKNDAKMKSGIVKKALVVWYSQTGNTARIGKLITALLNRAGIKTVSGDYRDLGSLNPADFDLLVIGSPVYYYEVPENFRRWIKSLPQMSGLPVASFVTFGGMGGNQHNTAVSLLDMIAEKGGVAVGMGQFGAMSTFAPTWSSGSSERVLRFSNQPDGKTYSRVREFTAAILRSVAEGRGVDSDYEFNLRDSISGGPSIFFTKLLISGHGVDRGRCTGCGRCVELCTVGAISPESGSVDTGKCIACIGCVNNCPVSAVEMKFMGKSVYGFNEFCKRNGVLIREPEEIL